MLEPLTIDEVLAATGGHILGDPHVPRQVAGICTDTRTLQPGELYAPLVGPRFDGHDFVRNALQGGAAACLAARSRLAGLEGVDLGRVIAVDDTLSSYHALAAHYRRKFAAPVVGVTGSNGKTTTKDLTAALLATHFANVLKTAENYNNEFGVPRTLFEMDESTGAAVVEMGMRLPGEIRVLARMAGPQVGLITMIGEAHLERLKSVEAIADAKGELLEALDADGVAVLPRDSAWYDGLAAKHGGRILSFGKDERADVRVVETVVTGVDGMEVKLDVAGRMVALPLPMPGLHNAFNLAAAVAAATALGVPLEVLERYPRHFRTTGRRMEPLRTSAGWLVLNDAYNASPASTRSALQTLAKLPVGGRRGAVLGDMLELGPREREMHRDIGRAAAEVLDFLVTVGDLGADLAEGARAGGMSAGQVHHVTGRVAAARLVLEWARRGDVVLVKASRGMQLDDVIRSLLP